MVCPAASRSFALDTLASGRAQTCSFYTTCFSLKKNTEHSHLCLQAYLQQPLITFIDSSRPKLASHTVSFLLIIRASTVSIGHRTRSLSIPAVSSPSWCHRANRFSFFPRPVNHYNLVHIKSYVTSDE